MSELSLSEFHFYDGDHKVNDTVNYVNILNVNKYLFMDDAYAGTNGFRDGTYLVPHTREMFYNMRRQICSYKNYVKPIIRALLEPVFTEDAPRVITDTAGKEIEAETMFGSFLDNVDNADTYIQDFSEKVIGAVRRHGVSFVVMDNFPESEQPETTDQAINSRIYPYVYQKFAWEVEDFIVDKFGRIQEITFKIEDKIENKTVIRQWRKWTADYSVVITKNQNGQYTESEPRLYHNLGVVPIISIYANIKEDLTDVLVDPPLFDLARLNHMIYNRDSEIRDLERAQAFSVLFIQGDDNGNFTVGPHNVLVIPPDVNIAPQYISPDSNILKVLRENNEALREDLFQIAEQNGVRGVASSKSGVAIQWDFFAHETQLKKTSKLATDLEQAIATLFKLYTQEEFEYSVEYPSDFQPGNALSIVKDFKEIISLGIPQKFKAILLEKVARVIMSDMDPERMNEVIEDIYEQNKAEERKENGIRESVVEDGADEKETV